MQNNIRTLRGECAVSLKSSGVLCADKILYAQDNILTDIFFKLLLPQLPVGINFYSETSTNNQIFN